MEDTLYGLFPEEPGFQPFFSPAESASEKFVMAPLD